MIPFLISYRTTNCILFKSIVNLIKISGPAVTSIKNKVKYKFSFKSDFRTANLMMEQQNIVDVDYDGWVINIIEIPSDNDFYIGSEFITNRGSFTYYKSGQRLLQIGSAWFITNRVKFITNLVRYYKSGHGLYKPVHSII